MLKPIIALFFSVSTGVFALDLYVSPSGNDNNAGTAASPFATLGRARDRIRTIKATSGLPVGGISVWLYGGDYGISRTITFDSRDSGTSTSPIVYRAMAGQEVSISGSLNLESSWFEPATEAAPGWAQLPVDSRNHVKIIRLKDHGILDYGSLRPRGFFQSETSGMELFIDGEPLQIARWPNVRESMIRTLGALSSTQFTYSDDRISKWAGAKDAWIHGYLGNTWSDYHAKMATINPATKTVTLAAAPEQFGLAPNRLFYAYNLLAELDQPGEYFLDRDTGVLYVWPSAELSGAKIKVSTTESFLISINGANYLTFSDIVFESTRGSLFNFYSGSNNLLSRCVFRNAGQNAVILDGTNNGIDMCEILNCGENGVLIRGGVRASLTNGGNFVSNSWIHRTSRIGWTYSAVFMSGGCGNRVSHNLIEEMPDSAIRFYGNNHIIEFNEIRRVCQESTDVGVIYTGKDWGLRGNIIRNNFIHSIVANQEGNGVFGIYIDDCGSGIEVSSNVIYDVATIGIAVRGGRDNVIRNNIIAKCGIAHSNSDSGRVYINNLPGDPYNLLEKLSAENIKYQTGVWAAAFPLCAAIPNKWTTLENSLWLNPEGSVFDKNIGWGNLQWLYELSYTGTGVFSAYASQADNAPNAAPLFGDEVLSRRASRPQTLAPAGTSFTPISFSSIRPARSSDKPTFAPASPTISVVITSQTAVSISWQAKGGISKRDIEGFVLERRNLPNGSWAKVRDYENDSSYDTFEGLAPGTAYSFRLQAYNSLGASYSNEVQFTTETSLVASGSPIRLEAETNYTPVVDVGTLASVSVVDSPMDTGKSVRIYDVSDAIRIPISVPKTGSYQLSIRSICGNRVNTTAFWPSGYRAFLDSEDLVFKGDTTTISALDRYLGQAYWGVMRSNIVPLLAGSHTLTISSAYSFATVDYVELSLMSPPVPSTFSSWQDLHFSKDQMSDPATSGSAATPASDNTANLMKYALGEDPWTRHSNTKFSVTSTNGILHFEYSRPSKRADVLYTVEASTDGVVWFVLPSALTNSANGIDFVGASGAVGSSFRFARLKVSQNGITVTSASLTPKVESSDVAHLTNLSVRAHSGIGEAAPIVGMSVRGAKGTPLLFRAVGPTLGEFGVSNQMADPLLRIYQGATRIAENDNWAWSDATVDFFNQTGAFSLPFDSKDALVLSNFDAGNFTAIASPLDGVEGVVLLEIFSDGTLNAGRLANLSARATAGSGSDTLIAGFVVSGTGEVTVLIRSIGPSLAQFGLTKQIRDPQLSLYRDSALISVNDNWGSLSNVTDVESAVDRSGAFRIERTSRDACLLVTLPPGVYTAHVGSVTSATGIALLEIYDLGATTD